MSFDTEILNIFAVIVIAALVLWLLILNRKIRRLSSGNGKVSLEQSIASLENDLKDLGNFRKDITGYLASVENRLSKSLQGVETIRFNPWKGTGDGGNQSFATAFIDEKGNGVVISSLYSRERTSVFSKPIKNFKSLFELTKEEQESIQKAKENTKRSSKGLNQ